MPPQIRKSRSPAEFCKRLYGLTLWRQSEYHWRQFKRRYRTFQQSKRSTAKDAAKREAKAAEMEAACRRYLQLAESHLERVLNVKGFEQRILYNAAKSYSRQLQQGEDYFLLNPVIVLTLTDFVLFEGEADTNRFLLLEKERFIQYHDDIELIFVELPKFTRQEQQLQSIKDKWLYFVKHAGSHEPP